MIHAKISNKSGKEDCKTSTIFEPLSYLPYEILWKLLRNSCTDNDSLPTDSGEIIKIDYWPNYSAKDNEGNNNTSNKSRVTPDMVIHFEKFDLIIEAKLKDVQSYIQHPKQWNNEFQSYRNKENMKDVIFIALGGNTSMQKEKIDLGSIHKCTWINLLNNICVLKEKMDHNDGATYRILSDLELAFSIYQEFYIKSWIKDLQPANLRYSKDYKIKEIWKI